MHKWHNIYLVKSRLSVHVYLFFLRGGGDMLELLQNKKNVIKNIGFRFKTTVVTWYE